MGGFLNLGYCLITIGYCFPIVFWMEENKVMIGRFPLLWKTLSTLPVSLKMSVKLQYMCHKYNCMAFVIAVLFSITDSRSLTSQKGLRT